jgi:hypothetical protein
MKSFVWNIEKEKKLQQEKTRNGITFADCVVAVDDGRILDIQPHPTRTDQNLLILNIENYAYVIPYIIEDDGRWFLKTVFPSRKHTAIYLSKKKP